MSSEFTPNTALLSATNLHIGYKDKPKAVYVAEAINFELHPGQLVAIVGVNGSGKSTLLKTLGGQLKSLAGSVNIHNTSIAQMEPKQLGTYLSLVLTNEPVSKQLSVLELVALGRHPYTNWLGRLSQRDIEVIEKALSQVSLIQKKNKPCSALSDGQFQRVLIARALAQDTELILMDEPTTHLDMFHKVYVLKLLKSIVKSSKKTILFASHEINLAIQLCDKIILINDGIVNFGTPTDLITEGKFDKLFPKDYITFDPVSKTFKMKIDEN